MTPTKSVVIASFRARALLEACVASVQHQCVEAGAELILARDENCGDLESIALAFPACRVVAAPPGATVPELRGAGMASARAQCVAILEDHCVVSDGWLVRLTSAMDGCAVSGGGMDNAQRERAIDWGAYFSEYGFFDTNRRTRNFAAPLLTGANVAYGPQVLPDVTRWMQEGAWENTIHDRLAVAGHHFRFVAEAVVAQNMRYAFGGFCVDRYVHGRDFARTRLRLSNARALQRITLALLSPLLPILLVGRLWALTTGRTWSRRLRFLVASPYTLTFLAAWSIGECVGYLLGPDRGESSAN